MNCIEENGYFIQKPTKYLNYTNYGRKNQIKINKTFFEFGIIVAPDFFIGL